MTDDMWLMSMYASSPNKTLKVIFLTNPKEKIDKYSGS